MKLSLLILLVAVIVLAFEVWMLVDVLGNKSITERRRILWVVLMLLIHPFVAIIYYFTDRQIA